MLIARFTYFLVVLSDFGVILLRNASASGTRIQGVTDDCTYATSVSSELGGILHLQGKA
jgi:hypothetical protein